MGDRRWEMGRFRTRKPGHSKRGMLASPDGAASLSPLQGLMGFYFHSRGFAPGLAISAPLGQGGLCGGKTPQSRLRGRIRIRRGCRLQALG